MMMMKMSRSLVNYEIPQSGQDSSQVQTAGGVPFTVPKERRKGK